ncbi:MAG: hypothetical protein EX270_08940 [Pseudomonadales bacterium]|nr:MAG: hypothetical protein EX270_08940 [Pseudomonadales bacterium]
MRFILLMLFALSVNAEVINAQAFGVKCAGATVDDTEAFERVFNAVKGKSKIVLPSGQCFYKKTLVLPPQVQLVGQGEFFETVLVPSGVDAIHVGAGDKWQARNAIRLLNITMSMAEGKRAIVARKHHNLIIYDVFIYSASNVALSLYDSNFVYLNNVVLYGDKKGTGLYAENTELNAVNLDVEAFATGIHIIGGQTTLTGFRIERFGKFGLLLDNSHHGSYSGANILPAKQSVSIAFKNHASNNVFTGGNVVSPNIESTHPTFNYSDGEFNMFIRTKGTY